MGFHLDIYFGDPNEGKDENEDELEDSFMDNDDWQDDYDYTDDEDDWESIEEDALYDFSSVIPDYSL